MSPPLYVYESPVYMIYVSVQALPMEPRARESLAVSFGRITQDNIKQLKTLNVNTFPVLYGPKFYKNITKTPHQFTKYAYFQSMVIGAICCRVENDASTFHFFSFIFAYFHLIFTSHSLNLFRGENKLYILTLAVLPVYRRRNVGSQLLNSVLDEARSWNEQKSESSSLIASIYLHVQTSNEMACAFYENHGFTKGDVVENYYKRIEPSTAFIYSLSFLQNEEQEEKEN